MSYFVHPSAIIDEPIVIGEGTKIWHFSHLMCNCKIGKDCILGQNSFVASKVIIGNNVKVQNNVSIYEGVEIGDHVFVGPSVVFTNVINPRAEVNRKEEFKKTIIGEGTTIGANATIVCGVNIGNYAFVAAGSVVTKDVAPYSLVKGNPARHSHWISRQGHKLNFEDNVATCHETKYKFSENQVSVID